MYQDFFGLNSKPFGIVPDTRFLFLSDSHKEAIAHLVYALNEKNGFVQLTGEVGVGKTMACRYILANIPKDIDVALILNPRVDELGLLRTLCQELKISFDKAEQTNELTHLINNHLLEVHAKGRHTILIIDEAQNLPKATLEQLRLLTNLETDTQKLLRIILIGQPELADLLTEHDMRQVAQRITSRYCLDALCAAETDEYIHHRLKVAGCPNRVFTKSATRKIFQLAQGTPRLINILCDRSLIGAYAMGTNEVSTDIVKKAAKEALPQRKPQITNNDLSKILIAVLTVLLLAVVIVFQSSWRDAFTRVWPFGVGISQIESVQGNRAPGESSQDVRPQDMPSTVQSIPPANETGFDTSDLRETASDSFQSGQAEIDPISDEQLDNLIRQADTDFRLGIPSHPKN